MPRIRINPLSRIHGYMSVEIEISNGTVADAWSSGLLYRGFESILKGRSPHDAVYLTQRICGICSSAHAIAAALTLENTFNIEVPHNGKVLRNLIFGADLIQNHLRHLYLLAIPDYISAPQNAPGGARSELDLRLPRKIEARIQENYLSALETSHLAHKAVATFGGKAPHLQSIVAGGVTEDVLTDRVIRFQALLGKLAKFINDKLLPDIEDIARYYADYYQIGKGYGNFLSFGMFPLDKDDKKKHFAAGLLLAGETQSKYDAEKISLDIRHAWYQGSDGLQKPLAQASTPAPGKDEAYSWIKAPRYEERAFEGGPLARMWLSGIYQNGISVMDRLMARAIEAREVIVQLNNWLRELLPDQPTINWLDPLPLSGEGEGLVEAMRGPLAHWVRIENRRIDAYRIITPSAWNLSPRDSAGQRGPLEEALVGTPVANTDNPVEVGRVVRSFDPCISCAVHVLDKKNNPRLWRRL
ncbi:MAG: nickel-dependent hydrogenase large subunit [Dethiobacter sp.]|nr:nickel-dependent hydrogenase large subunit [Dethiobacter sp.]MBS3900685.1 nickel-dependent hydrogenase large subunit [Dethiobacter sp.]MBS3989279.1 nickel-dependent hydrogenase large subunit [Dethiobacter sp.]